MTWRYTDTHEEFVHAGTVLVSIPLPKPEKVYPQTLIEADLLSDLVALERQGKWAEVTRLLRVVEPWDLAIWGDWWGKARFSSPLPALPEQAQKWGMGVGAHARAAADRVLRAAELRGEVRRHQQAAAEAVENLRLLERCL